MSRLEFRAWDNKNGGWTDIDDLPVVDLNSYVQLSIEQYTGLKDKNGVKIFEGDILEDKRGEMISVYPVEYRKNTASFTRGGWKMPSKDMISRWGTVKGNIHENPELLE